MILQGYKVLRLSSVELCLQCGAEVVAVGHPDNWPPLLPGQPQAAVQLQPNHLHVFIQSKFRRGGDGSYSVAGGLSPSPITHQLLLLLITTCASNGLITIYAICLCCCMGTASVCLFTIPGNHK